MNMPVWSPHSITKLADQHLTEYMDAGNSNLRVFSLSPGIVLTPMSHEFFELFAKDRIEPSWDDGIVFIAGKSKLPQRWLCTYQLGRKEMEAHKEEIAKKKLLKL